MRRRNNRTIGLQCYITAYLSRDGLQVTGLLGSGDDCCIHGSVLGAKGDDGLTVRLLLSLLAVRPGLQGPGRSGTGAVNGIRRCCSEERLLTDLGRTVMGNRREVLEKSIGGGAHS